jgi:hypothetical protein
MAADSILAEEIIRYLEIVSDGPPPKCITCPSSDNSDGKFLLASGGMGYEWFLQRQGDIEYLLEKIFRSKIFKIYARSIIN